ncbi:DUF4326 domain-containing protein [Arthrobacter sp. Soc17.1.1.1]|uniref:DUF4326 domain-containing protein n=1 Tax=Arthrobacter sp. Soc17.1.1.1 TaxID=3121277 RepID=UPI003FA5F727
MPAGAVYVGRGSRWGNPYAVKREGGFMWVEPDGKHLVCSTNREENLRERRTEAVAMYSDLIERVSLDTVDPKIRHDDLGVWDGRIKQNVRAALAGKDLACWCPLDQPCHADVLLELANDATTASAAVTASDAPSVALAAPPEGNGTRT